MNLRRILTIGAAAALLTASAAKAQYGPTYINPNGIGGYTEVTPGQPPTYINPNGIGGYTAITPGQAPTYINPNGIGGYTIIAPPSLPPVIPPPTLNPYGQDEQDEN